MSEVADVEVDDCDATSGGVALDQCGERRADRELVHGRARYPTWPRASRATTPVVLHDERRPNGSSPLTRRSRSPVQSLRVALSIYRPGQHPWQWSSSHENHADALPYLPSAHREENLQEAVELLEAVLEVRSPPLSCSGRVCVRSSPAGATRTARTLCERSGDPDAVELCDGRLAVADSGNNRVTIWAAP